MKKTIFLLVGVFIFFSSLNAQFGYRWTVKSSGTMSALYSSCFSNTSTNNYAGFICGANGTVLVSTDGYNTWLSKSVGVNVNLYSITIANQNASSVACCGDNGTVSYTSNAGTNWTQINSGTTAKLNCIFSNGTSLFAVGNGGTILKSTWTGITYTPFTQIPSGTTQNLHKITYGYDYYICGDNGVILRSTNQGLNWFSYPSPTTQNIYSISNSYSFVGICGSSGLFYATRDSGAHWINYPTGTANTLYDFEGYYMSGASGTFLYNKFHGSDDFSWKLKVLPVSFDLNDISYASARNSYFLIGSNGTIIKREFDTSMFYSILGGNNIKNFLNYSGVFDQDFRTANTPGFEWPAGSNKHVVFTTGLCAACTINGQLAETMCSYKGEYLPGAITNGQFNDSDIFKIYKVSRYENPPGDDWMNWGRMVPYGAPYVDVNNNGIYEPLIDTPGVKNAVQTQFICLTDFNPGSHNAGEGFGGGVTSPLMGIELHLTKWSYSFPSFNDVTFSKFAVINKSSNTWNKTYFSFVSDIDIGNSSDDWMGCDTVRNMGYGYNTYNNDAIYGAAPPAVGFDILKGPVNKRVYPNVTYNMNSFIRFSSSQFAPVNESDPNGEPFPAYLFMRGYKKDSAAWLDRTQPTPWGSYKKTKKIFYGDPETDSGWTASKGAIQNCCHDSTGILYSELPNDYRIVMGTGADNYSVYPGDTATIWLAQLVARGSSNLNSVTKLKQLSDIVQAFFESNFTVGVNQISSEVPEKYSLHQNYPNPFNPATKIKYSISKSADVKLTVYDVLGRKITELVNEKQAPGTYEVLFDAASDKLKSLSSGIYFYRLTAGSFSDTKRMILIK